MLTWELQDLLILSCPQNLYSMPSRDTSSRPEPRSADAGREIKGRVNTSERWTAMGGSRHLREKGRPSG